ncbi:hypothetical protein F5Y13DRAFT_173564 [Hypoxylon sp. FL1857]|nr:hypothetical protein F5Y13DRAFT_173564 [Hypoxylon sp. FL1857]
MDSEKGEGHSPLKDPKSNERIVEYGVEKSTQTDGRITKEGNTSENEPALGEDRPLTSEVRFYDYEGFMNRVAGDEGDYVVEALVSKADWRKEVEAEKANREDRRKRQRRKSDFRSKYKTGFSSGDPLKFHQGSKVPPEEGRIQRVRIRSEAVLCALASLSGSDVLEDEAKFEFCRPFRILEDLHEDMKRELTILENANKAIGDSPSLGSHNGLLETTKLPHEEPERDVDFREDIARSKVASSAGGKLERQIDTPLEHMRCYINFVERFILPIRHKFGACDGRPPSHVTYEEIPYLFRPGSLAFLPQQDNTLRLSAAQQVWRMVSCTPADHTTKFDEEEYDSSSSSTSTDEEDLAETKWSMYCLDYNGETLVQVWKTVGFEFFHGQRPVADLECYPLAFYPDRIKLLEEKKEAGRAFKSCIAEGIKHVHYSGWTFTTNILGERLRTNSHPHSLSIQAEHMDSKVIIDFKEALHIYPYWEALLRKSFIPTATWDCVEEFGTELLLWNEYPENSRGSGRSRPEKIKILSQEHEPYAREARKWMESDAFISGGRTFKDQGWTDEDLALLPRRLFAYVLKDRKFASLDIGSIDMNRLQSDVSLDDIQMKESHRKMIRSAVSAHFRSQKSENKRPSTIDLDIIRGKGEGLVILLHGPPGVGKTATAEAVAIENQRPLFPITCGDLGFSPGEVDTTLRNIFRYAHLWECILLLDEADIFLTQRDRNSGNLERNALVGVFLRVLEYYRGILFLTTNRTGALDEAFRSRAHISLSYPHLSLKDTLQILQSNLDRLPRVEQAKDKSSLDGYIKVYDEQIRNFIKKEFIAYSKAVQKQKGPWNGRQIRNAVQIAAGLALYEKDVSGENDGLPAILTSEQFRAVADTTSEFEEYLKSTKKGDDSFLAHLRLERDDDFHEEGVDEYSGYSEHSDTEPIRTTPNPRLTDSMLQPAGPGISRRKGGSNRAGPSGITHSSSPRLSPRPARQGKLPSPSYQEVQYDYDEAEDVQDDLPEEEEQGEMERGHSPQIAVRGGRPSPFGKRSDRYYWNQRT